MRLKNVPRSFSGIYLVGLMTSKLQWCLSDILKVQSFVFFHQEDHIWNDNWNQLISFRLVS